MAKHEPPVPLFEVAVSPYASNHNAESGSPEAAAVPHLTFARTRPWAMCGHKISDGDPGRQLGLADVDRSATCPVCIAMLDQWRILGVNFAS